MNDSYKKTRKGRNDRDQFQLKQIYVKWKIVIVIQISIGVIPTLALFSFSTIKELN